MLNVLVSVPSLIVYFQLRWLFKCSWNGWFYNPSSKRPQWWKKHPCVGRNIVLLLVLLVSSRISLVPVTWWQSVATTPTAIRDVRRWISSGFISTVAALRCRLPQLWNSVYVWLQLGVIQLLLVDEDHIILASLDSFDLHDYFHMNAICVFSTLCKLMFRGCRRFTIFSRISLVNGSSWFVVACSMISRDCSSHSSWFSLCTMVLQSALERRGGACC
jgi:hypothetical protein